MIFTTRAEWEIKDPMLKVLGADDSERTYPLIEIHLNVPLFRVDVWHKTNEDEKGFLGTSFLMAQIEYVKQIVTQEEVVKYDIYLETPRDIDNEDSVERHKVKRLSKIIRGEDKHGCLVEAYIFADSDYYISGGVESIDEIKNAAVVFDINELKGTGNKK